MCADTAQNNWLIESIAGVGVFFGVFVGFGVVFSGALVGFGVVVFSGVFAGFGVVFSGALVGFDVVFVKLAVTFAVIVVQG